MICREAIPVQLREQFSICHQKEDDVLVRPRIQMRYHCIPMLNAVDNIYERRQNPENRVVLPICHGIEDMVPDWKIRRTAVPNPNAATVINSHILMGWYIPGYPIVYVPPDKRGLGKIKNIPAVPYWADYAVSRLWLNAGHRQLMLYQRGDSGDPKESKKGPHDRCVQARRGEGRYECQMRYDDE
jgi:hypothetical protein